ncbi:hypothetical protein BGZ76_011369 [Entomortierella beljakovae]|nr:hypothetical protein BGZ76_011369 [Entomortierella beljakovae]
MSATSVVNAAKSAAVPSKTVYLFRHIQTSQVLVSLKNTVEKQSLKQITDETRRPPHVRPDHWQPLVAIQGFSKHQDALAFHNSLRDHQLNSHSTMIADEKHMLQPRRLRGPQEMNQVDKTLVKMVELLNDNPKIKNNSGKGIQLLWERDGVREQLLEKEGVSLLEGIQHGNLTVKRGRTIVDA